MRAARLIKTLTAMWTFGFEWGIGIIPGFAGERGDDVLLLAFHLLDCYAGLRNLDAALGPAGCLSVGDENTTPPPTRYQWCGV